MRLSVMLMLALVPWPALGQAGCDSPQTQMEMNRCVALDLEKAIDDMNAAYSDLMWRIPEEKRKDLREVQQAYISFKYRQCRLESSYAEGGSMQPMLRDACLERMSRQRITELQNLQNLLDLLDLLPE